MKKNKNFRGLFLSGVFFFVLVSIPFLMRAAWVGNTNNATLELSPSSGIYRVGATFPVQILVNTHGQNVVGVSAYLSYNTSYFRVVSIDTNSSLFSVEFENINATSTGQVKISRAKPTPGVNVVAGNVATLNVLALANVVPSADNFNFTFTLGSSQDSQVILDDQSGTNVLSGVNNGRFTLDGIAPANVSSFTATAGDGRITLNWVNPTSDFNGVKILRKTGSYSSNPTDGTVVYDDSGTNYINTGLANGTRYYYTAFSRDVVLNYSSGAQISAIPGDVTAPAQITGLAVVPLTARSVRLNWIAVGDDNNVGLATSYDLRYSTSLITAANFSTAAQASGEPNPGVNGVTETFTLSGLSGSTVYYFAIKAMDEAGNASILSNVVNALTLKISDLNNDNLVNISDAGIMMSYWSNTTRPAADLNQDGIVNINDAGIMMSQWGS